MSHYNWYDLTPYEKASILAAQVFPTYQGVGSPIDNGQSGNPGESYVDTNTDALYFNIGGDQWIAAGGTGGQNPAPIIAGTEVLVADYSHSLTASEFINPIPYSDWTIVNQTGTALSIDNNGNFVTNAEGTFSGVVIAKMTWDSIPFAAGSYTYFLVSLNRPNIGALDLSVHIPMVPNILGFVTDGIITIPPVHYVPANGDPSTGTILDNSLVFASAFPNGLTTVDLQLKVFLTNQ